MQKPLRLSSAASLLALGTMIAGCAAHQARLGAATNVGGKAEVQGGFGTRALAALNSGNAPLAIDLAQRAVAQSPTDAGYRTVLGNAYFAGGRFLSAEQAFRDSLTLDPEQPRVVLKLALVEIAQGKNSEAIALLNSSRGLLDASDYGLALALAGQPGHAVAVLEPAARQTGADATVRQNLALAYALAGDWNEARTIAAQDVPANQLDGRIQQWMQLASPKHPSDQVAALVGVTPAVVDGGQPVQLALNKTVPNLPSVAAPTRALAQTEAAPAQQPVEAPKPAFVAASPVAPPVLAVAPAPPPSRPTIATMASSAVTHAKDAVMAWLPHHQAPAVKAKPRLAARAPQLAGKSNAVVQLGAYGSADRVLAAWNKDAHKYGALRAFAPMSARFASPKGTFYRLSVHGFGSVGQAIALCNSLRHQGGSCFVRNVAGDAPVNIALR